MLWKTWGTIAMMFKAFPLTVLWSVLLNFERANDDLMLKMRLISSEICPETSHKIGRYLPIVFWQSLPQNSCEIGWFFREFVPQNSPKFGFFSTTYQKPWLEDDLPGPLLIGQVWFKSYKFAAKQWESFLALILISLFVLNPSFSSQLFPAGWGLLFVVKLLSL